MVTMNGRVEDACRFLWGMSFESFPFGVTVARKFAPVSRQRALLDYVLAEINVKTMADEMEDPSRRYSQLAMWNWPSRYGSMVADDSLPSLPEPVFQIAREFKAVYSEAPPMGVEPLYVLPSTFVPDSLRVIAYGVAGELPEHTDMYMGHTISISLGGACVFKYGSHYEDGVLQNVTSFVLKSGDVAVFNGQKLPHSVYDVSSDMPEWWVSDSSPEAQRLLENTKRINFQVRHCAAVAAYGH